MQIEYLTEVEKCLSEQTSSVITLIRRVFGNFVDFMVLQVLKLNPPKSNMLNNIEVSSFIVFWLVVNEGSCLDVSQESKVTCSFKTFWLKAKIVKTEFSYSKAKGV